MDDDVCLGTMDLRIKVTEPTKFMINSASLEPNDPDEFDLEYGIEWDDEEIWNIINANRG